MTKHERNMAWLIAKLIYTKTDWKKGVDESPSTRDLRIAMNKSAEEGNVLAAGIELALEGMDIHNESR